IINTRNPKRTQIQRHRRSHQLRTSICKAKPLLPIPRKPNLVMIIYHRDDFYPIPSVAHLPQIPRIRKQGEILPRRDFALRHVPELVLHATNPQRRVVARDLAHEQEMLFAESLRELMDRSGEIARGTETHVFYGVDAEAVEVGV